MVTPMLAADCVTIWAYWGSSGNCWVMSWAVNPEGCPAAASSVFAVAMSWTRWGTLMLYGTPGASSCSPPDTENCPRTSIAPLLSARIAAKLQPRMIALHDRFVTTLIMFRDVIPLLSAGIM
jgi:hypothetical protein